MAKGIGATLAVGLAVLGIVQTQCHKAEQDAVNQEILAAQRQNATLLGELLVRSNTSHEQLLQEFPLGYALFQLGTGVRSVWARSTDPHPRFKIGRDAVIVGEVDGDDLWLTIPELTFLNPDGSESLSVSGNSYGFDRRTGRPTSGDGTLFYLGGALGNQRFTCRIIQEDGDKSVVGCGMLP